MWSIYLSFFPPSIPLKQPLILGNLPTYKKKDSGICILHLLISGNKGQWVQQEFPLS